MATPARRPAKPSTTPQKTAVKPGPVRIGIIGVGNMGSCHAQYIREGKIKNAVVAAIADRNPAKLENYRKWEGVELFSEGADLIRSVKVDAVLIATPHYDHTTLGIAALKKKLHVLVEKPISVHKADCERLIAAHTDKKVVFAAMFNQRTINAHVKIKKLMDSGELGRITRVNWIITNWFRTAAYYASGDWRATWAGEGGGVLLNQCPHNLDLLTWFCGMPSKVRATCRFGQWHDIEVEDDVTAVLEYPNGASGVFITTTGEAPGTNRLEIVGERGKVVYEHGKITYTRNEVSMIEFCKTTPGSFSAPEVWNIDIPGDGSGPQHQGITQNFVDAILTGATLIAPAEEGIRSVELANAMLLSAFLNKTIELPLSGSVYEKELKKRIATSRYGKKKAVKAAAPVDMSKSFTGI